MKRLIKRAEAALFKQDGSIDDVAIEDVLDNGTVRDFYCKGWPEERQTYDSPGHPATLEVSTEVVFDFSGYNLTEEQKQKLLSEATNEQFRQFASSIIERSVKKEIGEDEELGDVCDVRPEDIDTPKFEGDKLVFRVYFDR